MNLSPIRKVFQGVADRRQMFHMFDRHAQRPNRGRGDDGALYRGEWFEVAKADHDYMFEILPPLFMHGDMFALREFLTGNITSVFIGLSIDGRFRYFHSYCDLSEKGSPERMRDAIIARESHPVRAMTREERIEHIWSSTHDDYRGYADGQWMPEHRGKRTVLFYGTSRGAMLRPGDPVPTPPSVAKTAVLPRLHPGNGSPSGETSRSTCADGRAKESP